MSHSGAWDVRYDHGGFTFGEAPNRFLESLTPRLRPGMRALALADGEGRNGVWLARQGLVTTSVDWSPVGLAKAGALAARQGVALETVTADLSHWDWPVGRYDLIAWIFLHMPSAGRAVVAARAAEALAPGGLLAYECFTPGQEGRPSGGPRDPDLLADGAWLRQGFPGLVLEECLTGTVTLDEGPKHQGHAEVARAIFRRL